MNNNLPIIKICGLTSTTDIQMCLRNGVRHLGFVVEYPERVPWNLSRDKAKALLATVPKDMATYVVCGGCAEKILDMARYLKPTAIQIHHRESIEDVTRIAEALAQEGIATFRAVSPETPEDALAALCAMPDLAGLVADSRTPDTASHHGKRLDAAFYLHLRSRFPRTIFLGGGITPDNLHDIVAETRATALDILTGIETSPGHKDEAKLKQLIL
ncbi:MAG: phosphoribosylanthranilate isomerase [Kiritimatiellaeota bacterium]|nr:phosphoribosylanthranilate isomerase [Kiritimatiellota bacterium]